MAQALLLLLTYFATQLSVRDASARFLLLISAADGETNRQTSTPTNDRWPSNIDIGPAVGRNAGDGCRSVAAAAVLIIINKEETLRLFAR